MLHLEPRPLLSGEDLVLLPLHLHHLHVFLFPAEAPQINAVCYWVQHQRIELLLFSHLRCISEEANAEARDHLHKLIHVFPLFCEELVQTFDLAASEDGSFEGTLNALD